MRTFILPKTDSTFIRSSPKSHHLINQVSTQIPQGLADGERDPSTLLRAAESTLDTLSRALRTPLRYGDDVADGAREDPR